MRGDDTERISLGIFDVRWTVRDVITYALASGADGSNGLHLVHEGRGPQVLPTFATRLAATPLLDCFRQLLQRYPGRQIRQIGAGISADRPIPPEGVARVRAAATTTPHPSGTSVELDAVVEQPDATLCRTTATILVQDDRSSKRSSGTGGGSPFAPPGRSFHAVVGAHQYPTFRLLLPLSLEEPVPDALHVEPTSDGAPPILAGEVTMGIACRSLVELRERQDDARLRALSLEFSGPVRAGDELTTEITGDGDDWTFVVRNQLHRVVVNAGRARFA